MTRADQRTGGDDAVCFTAGPRGLAYGAGVIHAYLAADRKPPRVAAGISTGSLSAAALQRAYRELEQAGDGADEEHGERLEARRWRWFQRYLKHMTRNPFGIFWRALPNPVDFFSERPPVRDLSCPPELRGKEARSRHAYFLLVLLGRWLARLPITVRDVTRLAVAHVRHHEGYTGTRLTRWLGYVGLRAWLALRLVTHFVSTPMWVPEWMFWQDRRALGIGWLRRLGRPLFGGWWFAGVVLWLILVGSLLSAFMKLVALSLRWSDVPFEEPWGANFFWIGLVVFAVLWVLWLLAARVWKVSGTLIDWMTRRLMKRLDLSRGLLNDFHLHRRLLEVFGEADDNDPKVQEKPMHLVVVAAPLNLSLLRERESLDSKRKPHSGQQLWAKKGASLITALRAALAIPTLLPPVRLTARKDIRFWWSSKDTKPPAWLDLVDGAVVRKNPLPALFGYLREPDQETLAHELCVGRDGGALRQEARVHVVYNVPIEPRESTGDEENLDILESASLSLRLASRRDTRMEVRQTNFFSKLQLEILHAREKNGHPAEEEHGSEVLPIFVDEIAPETDIRFDNELDPSRKELLEVSAAGCRRTLETLFGDELRTMGPGPVPCHWLLDRVAPRRAEHISREAPGIPEVCRECTRKLQASDRQSRIQSRMPGLQASFGPAEPNPEETEPRKPRLDERFPHLTGEQPRIVFLASGGVFRGATHIGAIGAMHAMKVKPDLVVGASVGSLMGGALAAISRVKRDEGSRLLARLTDTFLRVDETVALTRVLKNAAKQLAVRGRSIRLSPHELRRQISRGSASDPGFAAVGAPSVLTDALSQLFLLPHTRTTEIAAEFVAGHFSDATAIFLEQIRKETLRRLEIRYALMGTELLEPKARELLGEDLRQGDERVFRMDCCQPYHRLRHDVEPGGTHRWISVFSTTTLIHHHHSFLLGRDFLRPAVFYDFVHGGLCSSAFPAVFSPRSEAEVLPGVGRSEVRFADGGMFDNLPFFPALKVLESIQQEYRRGRSAAAGEPLGDSRISRELLRRRYEQPDLFLTAALEAPPEQIETSHSELDSLRSIRQQARSLRNNLKIASFELGSRVVDRQVGELLELGDGEDARDFLDQDLVDGFVSSAVLPVIPKDPDHLNPTFACSRSLGLDPQRVSRAIAHGCFQTFATLAAKQPTELELQRDEPIEEVLKRCLAGLQTSVAPELDKPRLPRVIRRDQKLRRSKSKGVCPFFQLAWRSKEGREDKKSFACPFVRAAEQAEDLGKPQRGGVHGVYTACCKDPAHDPHSPAL